MSKFIKLTDYKGNDTIIEVSHLSAVEHKEDEDIGVYAQVVVEADDRLIRYNVLETVEEVWQKLRCPLTT